MHEPVAQSITTRTLLPYEVLTYMQYAGVMPIQHELRDEQLESSDAPASDDDPKP